MKSYTLRSYNQEHMARAIGIALPISLKQSVELCRFIKNKNVNEAKKLLQKTIDRKLAVPFRKFNRDLGHKKKTGPARYPKKASKAFMNIIENVEANAQFKGLNTSNLIITHVSSHKASKSLHFGRKSRRKMKRTNIEIVVEERVRKND